MSERRVRFVRVHIRRSEHGLLVATSPSVPGMLVIAKNEDELNEDIPVSIQEIWRETHGEQVRVLPAILDDEAAWAAIPAELASVRLAEC